MNTSDKVKKELDTLLNDQSKLLKLVKDYKDIIDFGTKYQHWYSRSYKLVESLAHERLEEFVAYYLIDQKRKNTDATNYAIQDYIKGVLARADSYGKARWDIHTVVGIRILNQMQILASLSSRIDSVLQDVAGHLYAEIQDSELAAANQLKKINYRAAGSLAGVILERHLQHTAANHKITIRKKTPTISDLNDPLKKATVYDVPTWRKIQLLADIRNLCSHQKDEEPTKEQVDELITGVNTVIKTVF